jgi:hypothetical protein
MLFFGSGSFALPALERLAEGDRVGKDARALRGE